MRTLLRTRGAHAQECYHNEGPVSYQADATAGRLQAVQVAGAATGQLQEPGGVADAAAG